MALQEKMLQIISANYVYTERGQGGDYTLNKTNAANQCAKIAEQEKISFAIEVLEEIHERFCKEDSITYNKSIHNKIITLKSKQDLKI